MVMVKPGSFAPKIFASEKESARTNQLGEPVWPGGRALCWFDSVSALLSLQKLRPVDTVTLFLIIKQTLKCLSSLPILMRESFWW